MCWAHLSQDISAQNRLWCVLVHLWTSPSSAGMNSEPQYESHNKYNLLDLAEKEITDDKVLIKLDKPQN